MRWLERYLTSPFPRPPAATLLEVHLASFTVAGGGAVAAFGAVTRVPVFRPRVPETDAVDVAEIPRLALE